MYVRTLGVPTHVDPRADAFSSLALTCEKLFSAFKRRRVHAEKCWNVGITRACVRVGVCTRERTPAFDCILRIYSDQRIYARRVRDLLFLPFFSLFSSPSLSLLPFSIFHVRARALAFADHHHTFQHDATFIDSLTPNYARTGILCHFHFWNAYTIKLSTTRTIHGNLKTFKTA